MVAINPDGSGMTNISKLPDWENLVTRVSGHPSEMRYCSLHPEVSAENHPDHHAHDDGEKAWALARAMAPNDYFAAGELLKDARALASALVLDEWDRIERVALALYASESHYLTARAFLDAVS